MNFKPIQHQESGIKITGMIRDIKRLKIKNQDHILIAVNNEKVRLMKLNTQKLKS
jgi:starvation-inducible outer membrane lipoprotein